MNMQSRPSENSASHAHHVPRAASADCLEFSQMRSRVIEEVAVRVVQE